MFPTATDDRPLVETLRERRATAQEALDAVLVAPTAESRDLTVEEATTFEAQLVELRGFDERIAQLDEAADRRDAAAAAAARSGPTIRTVSEPLTYRGDNAHEFSYFRDLARFSVTRDADAATMARLLRHAQEMDVELPARAQRRLDTAERETRAEQMWGRGDTSPFEQRVNPNRTDGQGGYFVPPLWLIDEYLPLLRAGRTFANSVRQIPLPEGTDSINIPRVLTGTTTAAQTADAAGVSSTDLTDAAISAPVRTIAGQQDVALQLLEQSPIAFDEVVFTDLIADYNMRVDLQCLSGSGAAGQLAGIQGLAGTNAITYTDATPTGPEFYAPLAQSLSQVARLRLRPATAIFMHTRRWYWLASQLDGNLRPLVVPEDNGPFNALSLQLGVEAEGPVGRVLGCPILIDPNITVTDNATQDQAYAVRTSDLFLFEGDLRTRVLAEVLSGTLQVRFQIYAYLAFLPNRYPTAISVIAGTGLAAPAGF